MSVDENKALAQRLYDDLFNHSYLAAAAELVAASFVEHGAARGTPPGPAGALLAATRLRAAFPDGRYVIEDLIGEDDMVVARLTFAGTHQGSYQGVAPTGRRVTQAQMHILRIAGGHVAECWAVRDDVGLLAQVEGRRDSPRNRDRGDEEDHVTTARAAVGPTAVPTTQRASLDHNDTASGTEGPSLSTYVGDGDGALCPE